MPLNRNSSPEAKIALFRSLFRGREDVFARRFESRQTGRGGYAPVCANEWAPGLCEKPRTKCAVCANRRFIPVSNAVIRAHLLGHDTSERPFVMGCYPMLHDETCFFLAIDLDKEGWQQDSQALLDTCDNLQLPATLERSRSGNGAHLWLFFQEAISAVLARKLGSHLLTETMKRRPELGFTSYDRLFPNQDTLPKGGFGNLIALPLQAAARRSGNSLFVDRSLQPFNDQWAFLSGLQRLSAEQVCAIVKHATASGSVLDVRAVPNDEELNQLPWELTPSREVPEKLTGRLPEKICAVLSDQIYLPRSEMGPQLRNRLLRLAAFQNPEFYRAQAMRLPTYDKARIIACAEEFPDHIALPRGCLTELRKMLRINGITFRLKDKRNAGTHIDVSFRGQLRDDQTRALKALLADDTGVLAATTAFGKTVLAAALIAERGVNTLILVHRQQLMTQWSERLTSFLNLKERDIGRLGGGRKKLKGKVDIALLQSLVRKGVVDDRIAEYGQVIVDECHHVSAHSFELAIRRAKAKYILGLSATVTRKDGHQPIIFMQCGPIRFRVEARQHADTAHLSKQVIVRATRFSIANETEDEHTRTDFAHLIDQLSRDAARNAMIRDDVDTAVCAGAFPLILTERTEHLDTLATLLETRQIEAIRLRGGMSGSDLRDALANINAADTAKRRAIVATGRFIGEGFDASALDALFVALPVSWKGTVAQYVGRLHRSSAGKKRVRVFDYADLNVPMLARMFDRRCRAYRKQGYTILLPASAIPGWPQDVPLPIDEKWKQTYATSVQRLIRDGVDVPLAELFADLATIDPLDDKQGVDRARSSSEAFLFKRLESLPETQGRFTLNAKLTIPFRNRSFMEVDFLNEQARLVIELDGARHFSDHDAYRRDREKDYLLQECGYRIVRFLAEDLGSHLNDVLDTILRAQAHRQLKP
jgi:superfamily II DNA or RNA helicase